VAVLGAMRRQRVAPEVVTCSAAISACRQGERWAHALALLGGMPQDRLAADAIAHNAALSSCQATPVGYGSWGRRPDPGVLAKGYWR